MIDITHKRSTLRSAVATSTVKVSAASTIETIRNNEVPKGNIFEMAKAAALLAIKKTSDVIPDCHPLPVESATVHSVLEGDSIVITVEVKTVYKTGVEVEAMYGATVAALTMYDMLKPIDKGVEIHSTKLLSKKGGKSGSKALPERELKAAVVVCSDSVSAGKKQDTAGKAIAARLEQLGISAGALTIIPDREDLIRKTAEEHSAAGTDIIIFTGGTGLSRADVTPETIRPLLDREIEGLMEAARSYGMERTPMAMLSRGVAGMRGRSLILTFPGSVNAAEEYMQALFPHVLHIFAIMDGEGHG